MAKKVPPPEPALQQQMISAVEANDVATVNKLLADGFPIDAPLAERHKETALGVAIRTGGKVVDVIFALIDAGADLRKGGVTMLTAVQFKSEPFARRLIETGFDPNVKNRFRESALEIAARDPSILEIVRMLIAAGASVKGEAINSAAAAGNLQAARMILDAGAKVPSEAHLLGDTIFRRDAAMARLLISAGADLNERSLHGEWQRKSDGKSLGANPTGDDMTDREYVQLFSHATPLIIAAGTGQADVAKALIDAGADMYLTDKAGETALDRARRDGHGDVVALLEGAIQSKPKAADLGSDLLLAAEKGHLAHVKSLLAAGAKTEKRDERPLLGGLTPLMHAAKNGHAEIVAALLDAGADIAAVDNTESNDASGFSFILNEGGVKHVVEAGYQLHRTALHWAAVAGQAAAAKVLIDRGASISAIDRTKMMPLHLAAEFGSTEIVQALLDKGAKADERGRKKATALMIAAGRGHLDVAKALLAAGAKVDLNNSEAETALQLAAENARPEIVTVLLAAGADFNAIDKGGSTVLAHSISHRLFRTKYSKGGKAVEYFRPQEDIVRCATLLIEAGADPNAGAGHAFTAMKHAERMAQDDAAFFNQLIDLFKTAQPKAAAAAPKPAKPKLEKKPAAKKSKSVDGEEIIRPDFSKAAIKPEFLAALDDLEKQCGSKRHAFDTIPGGFAFEIADAKLNDFNFAKAQETLLKQGCLIFRPDHESTSRLAAIPTTDCYDALRAMLTNGQNEDLMPEDIIAALKKLEKDHPFVLTIAGFDFVGGDFTTPLTKPAALAKQLVKLCSDLLESADENDIGEELARKQSFFLWWD